MFLLKMLKSLLLDDIDVFETHNIPLTPLNVKLTNNTKEHCKVMFRDSHWNNKTKNINHTYDFARKSINDNNVMLAIRAGKANDFCVIDWDVINDYLPTEDSICIKELCIKSNTSTIRTPRGGYHFIFKYDKDVPNGKSGNLENGEYHFYCR